MTSPTIAADTAAAGLHSVGSELRAPPLARDAAPPAVPTTPPLIFSNPGGGHIRPLERDDLPAVATLFLNTFRPRPGSHRRDAVEDVVDYMRQIYLDGPCCAAGVNSLVHLGPNGEVGGFLGLIKSSFLLDGVPMSAGTSSALMASDAAVHRRVGPQLMRAVTHCGLDLYLTDSANRTSAAFARPMRYEIALLNSLEWSRPFRPAAMLLDATRRRWPKTPAALLAPVAQVADAAAGRALGARSRRPLTKRWHVEAVDATTFARLAPGFLSQFRLRPAWTGREIDWLLAKAAQQRSNGPLHLHLVMRGAGAPIGCFAFHGSAGGQAAILQILAEEGQWDCVLDAAMRTAEAMGCAAVHGPAQAWLMPHLFAYPNVFFYHAGATMVYSRHPEVVHAVRTEAALIGGLAGDRWTRLGRDAFGQVP